MANQEHPSNRLYSGEVGDFYDAMRLVRAEYDYEARHAFDGDDGDAIAFRETVKAVNQAVDRAQSIYHQCMEEARLKAAALMRAEEGTHYLTWIADAVDSGDYSQLAI